MWDTERGTLALRSFCILGSSCSEGCRVWTIGADLHEKQRLQYEGWVEQWCRDTLKLVLNASDVDMHRLLPLDRPIWVSFYCCQQFIISREMVRCRLLSVWACLYQEKGQGCAEALVAARYRVHWCAGHGRITQGAHHVYTMT